MEVHDIRSITKSNECQMSSNSSKNRILFQSFSPINNHNNRIIIPKQEYITKAVAISKPITVTSRPPPPIQPMELSGGSISPTSCPIELAHISPRAQEQTQKSFSCLECGLVYSKRQATTDMLQVHDKLCDQWRSIWMQNENIKVKALSAKRFLWLKNADCSVMSEISCYLQF